jgi:hypothetical protein
MTDDVGFGAPSTFGGVIPTPALDRIAAAGRDRMRLTCDHGGDQAYGCSEIGDLAQGDLVRNTDFRRNPVWFFPVAPVNWSWALNVCGSSSRA